MLLPPVIISAKVLPPVIITVVAIVVIVPVTSSSSASIIATVGRTSSSTVAATHGKGTVQELLDLRPLVARFGGSAERDAGALKYTSSQFYRVTGKSTQRVGVVPDVIIPSPYDGLDSREGDLDHALPYDEIDRARFKPLGAQWDLARLRTASEARVGASAGFQMMAELREARERTDGEATSLQLSQRQAERDEWKLLEERAEARVLDVGEGVLVRVRLRVRLRGPRRRRRGRLVLLRPVEGRARAHFPARACCERSPGKSLSAVVRSSGRDISPE